MIPLENRLKRSGEIRDVIKKGKTFSSPAFFFRLKNNNLSVIRAGFVISSKAIKKAVLRNKIKRRAREIFRKLLPDLKGAFDMVFIFSNKSRDFEFKDLELGMRTVLKRSGLL